MRNIVFILAFALLASGCKKKYRYVETKYDFLHSKVVNNKVVFLEEEDDTQAYISAFKSFEISKAGFAFNEGDKYLLDSPMFFSLYNQDDLDIAKNFTYSNQDSIEKALRDIIYNIVNDNREKPVPYTTDKDSATIKKLIPLFTIKRDEFSTDQSAWVVPKSKPQFINQNGFYSYFQYSNGVASNFRFVIQYAADDWLFIKNAIFSADNLVFEYYPSDNFKRDNNSTIWEWSDQNLGAEYQGMMIAISKANQVKVKLVGSDYSKVKELNKKQIESLKNTYNLYIALGGKF